MQHFLELTPLDMDEQWYGLILWNSDSFRVVSNIIFLTFIILRYYALTTSSPVLIIFPSMVWNYCSVYGSDKYFTTEYTIVVVSVACIAAYLPNWTRDAIFSLMPSITTLCTASKYSLDVFLLVNFIMFKLLKYSNTGQYVKSSTGC